MLEVLGLAKSFGLQAIFKNFRPESSPGGALRFWWAHPGAESPPFLTVYPAVALGDRCLCGDTPPLIWPHALATALEIILGIVLALVTLIPLSIFMFARPGIEKGLAPFLVASQAVPVFALAPLLVIWLGYGIWSNEWYHGKIVFERNVAGATFRSNTNFS